MRIKVSCQSCSREFSAADDLVGRRVKCPSCGEPVRVTDSGDDGDESAIVLKRGRPADHSAKKRSARPAGNNYSLAIGLGIGGGIVVLGLIVMATVLLMSPRPPAPAVAAAAPESAIPVAAASTPHSPPQPVSTPVGTKSEVAASEFPAKPEPEPIETPADNASEKDLAAASDDPPLPDPALTQPTVVSAPLKGVPEPSKEKLELPQIIERVEPAVVRINVLTSAGPSTGSGFVVSTDGTVVTNYHVVTDALEATVEFRNGSKAKVLGYRHLVKKADIAIIKIDMPADKLRPVPLATELPRDGAYVATIGAPQGLSFSKSAGVISAIREESDLGAELGLDMIGTWLQFDASISPGNSGGPLVDQYGKVVGMNTMQLSVGQNLNFAISSLDINQALRDASPKVKPLKPEDLKPYQRHLARKRVSDEYDTERGRRLFAEVKEIILINGAKRRNIDPSGAIWERVILRSQRAVEKSGIQLSVGEPRPDVAFLTVIFEMSPSRKGTDGTQELSVSAELTCVDPAAKKNASPLANVWKAERKIGTISLKSAALGNVPQSVDSNLADFFGSFRTAYNRAVKANREAKKAADDKSPPAPDF